MPSAPSSLRNRSGFTGMRVIPTPPPDGGRWGRGRAAPVAAECWGREGEGGGRRRPPRPRSPRRRAQPLRPPPGAPPPPPVTRRAPWKREERSVRTAVAAVINFGGIQGGEGGGRRGGKKGEEKAAGRTWKSSCLHPRRSRLAHFKTGEGTNMRNPPPGNAAHPPAGRRETSK